MEPYFLLRYIIGEIVALKVYNNSYFTSNTRFTIGSWENSPQSDSLLNLLLNQVAQDLKIHISAYHRHKIIKN